MSSGPVAAKATDHRFCGTGLVSKDRASCTAGPGYQPGPGPFPEACPRGKTAGSDSLLPALQCYLPSRNDRHRSEASQAIPDVCLAGSTCAVVCTQKLVVNLRRWPQKMALCESFQARPSPAPSTESARCAPARGPAAGSATPPGGAPPTARSGAHLFHKAAGVHP